MLAMALIGVMLVVRAGPACAGMLQPVPIVAQAGAPMDMDCHGMIGNHERGKGDADKNVQATCGAACMAVPPATCSPPALTSMSSAEPDARPLVMSGLSLAPVPPPPRA